MLLRSKIRAGTRRGFTLVELLVAAALTMLIMTILASAFQTAMDSLSHLRSAGELQDRLRTASERLRQDLAAPHFEDEGIRSGKLSNARLDKNPNRIPQAGFFRIDQDDTAKEENATVQGRPVDYSTGSTVSRLLFTTKLTGKNRQGIFTAPRIGTEFVGQQGLDEKHDNLLGNSITTYGSQWGMISWFLVPSGESTVGANPQPLYTLRRQVQLLAEVPDVFVNKNDSRSKHYSKNSGNGRVNTPKDVSTGRSIKMTPAEYALYFTPEDDGSDIVLSNVVSFEVKAEYSPVDVTILTPSVMQVKYPRTAANTLNAAVAATLGVTQSAATGFNQDYPFDDLPKNPNPVPPTNKSRAFDTGLVGGTGLNGQNVQIRAVQIKLRIYDPKTKNTRQITIVQDM